MLYRNRIVRIEYVDTGSNNHGQFRVDKKGTIYLSIDRELSYSEIMCLLRDHWVKGVIKTGLIKQSNKITPRKILSGLPQKQKQKKHSASPSRYNNHYPSYKARIIYTPM